MAGPLRQAFLAFERASTALATAFACAMLVVASALGLWQIVTRFIIEFRFSTSWRHPLTTANFGSYSLMGRTRFSTSDEVPFTLPVSSSFLVSEPCSQGTS